MPEYLRVIDHDHTWSNEVSHSRWSGMPHRECTEPFCKAITLDLSDEDELEED